MDRLRFLPRDSELAPHLRTCSGYPRVFLPSSGLQVERSAVTTVAAAAESIPVAIAVAVVVLFLVPLRTGGDCCAISDEGTEIHAPMRNPGLSGAQVQDRNQRARKRETTKQQWRIENTSYKRGRSVRLR